MKKLGLIFAGCLAFIGLCGARADDIGDAVRAATRRDTTTATVSLRQRTDSVNSTTTSRNSSNEASGIVTRGTTNNRNSNSVNRSATNAGTVPTNVVARTTVSPRTRANTPTKLTSRSGAITTRTPTRTATRGITRAATPTATREGVLMRNYSKCREVFNECMDEFCANKDAQLKRCACSARVNDFNKIKQQLADIDEKMLDFNQRLLTVSMDEKDVAVLNTATEGEKAFYDTRDVSASKRALDAIAKKLNADFDTNNYSSSIGSVLSWSLDMDSAFDTIDSIGGASTAAKSGTALYSAALPVCREMAAEVCSDDDLALAESGYQILIGQACDTVEKTYKTAAEQARAKVMESSALLDMSRLDVHQKNNADDILTCKRKMLTMLSDSTVCGENLGKCLDITGQYIDPSTGEAFLSSDLSDLGYLITRPDGDQSWTSVPGNAPFVTFLDSKKKFLETAMENCRDISDTVWDNFIEDALSQIKIAQIRKLEDVRQSCTTLVAQCLTNASDSLTAFDARALSTFGVAADMTANAMCQGVLSSCTTLLETTDPDKEWYYGMTSIQTDITYDTIKHTCDQVGRACIIQVCTSTSGNFGLCENIDMSINRKSIINHTACWDEVLNCVASAGSDTLSAIFEQNGYNVKSKYKLYSQLYDEPTNSDGLSEMEDPYTPYLTPTISNTVANTCVSPDGETCVYDMCYEECNHYAYDDNDKCRACRIAESIWGTCEADPTISLNQQGSHNRVKVPQNSQTTLLYWFVQNTGTKEKADNCRDTTCPAGYTLYKGQCVDSANMCIDGKHCTTTDDKISIFGTDTCNCCDVGVKVGGNCCIGNDVNGVCLPSNATEVASFNIAANASTYYPDGDYKMYCNGNMSGTSCNGHFIIVKNNNSRYMDPCYNGETTGTSCNNNAQYVKETFETNNGDTTYTHTYQSNGWNWVNGSSTYSGATPEHWTVSFGNSQ